MILHTELQDTPFCSWTPILHIWRCYHRGHFTNGCGLLWGKYIRVFTAVNVTRELTPWCSFYPDWSWQETPCQKWWHSHWYWEEFTHQKSNHWQECSNWRQCEGIPNWCSNGQEYISLYFSLGYYIILDMPFFPLNFYTYFWKY